MLSDFDFNANYSVDFIYHADDINSEDILGIGSMRSLWGKGVDEAYVVVKGIKVTKERIQLLSADRNPTLKITLKNGLSFIKFSASLEEFKSLINDNGYVEIDVCGKCSINEWNGKISPQIMIEEYEIVGNGYYF